MGTRLFVGNLPWTATEDELKEFLGGDDVVTRVRIVTDRETGRSRGFAFADMASDAIAEDAIKRLDGKVFGGRDLRVNEATERPRPSGGGGYGGGGHGGGGGGDRGRGQRGGGSKRRRGDDAW